MSKTHANAGLTRPAEAPLGVDVATVDRREELITADAAAALEATENERAARRNVSAKFSSTPKPAERTVARSSGKLGVQNDVEEFEETLDATVGLGQPAPAFEAPAEKRYDPAQYQDTTRSYIAYWLLLLLTLLILSTFGSLFVIQTITFENVKSIIELILGPIIALVSAATGFYFGAQQQNKKI